MPGVRTLGIFLGSACRSSPGEQSRRHIRQPDVALSLSLAVCEPVFVEVFGASGAAPARLSRHLL